MSSNNNVKKISLIDILSLFDIHYSSIKRGGNDIWYLSPFRKENTPSFHVNVSLNIWYDHGLGKGGDVIDFLIMFVDDVTGYQEAIDWLNDFDGCIPNFKVDVDTSVNSVDDAIDVTCSPTVVNSTLRHYYKQRGLDVTAPFFRGCQVDYKREGKLYFAIGHSNDSGGYELNCRNFKGCLGRKGVSFFALTSDDVVSVFESWTDYYSLREFVLRKPMLGAVVILNSVSLLASVKELLPKYGKIYGFLDNDTAGGKATDTLALMKNFVDRRSLYSGFKDMNEYWSSRIVGW